MKKTILVLFALSLSLYSYGQQKVLGIGSMPDVNLYQYIASNDTLPYAYYYLIKNVLAEQPEKFPLKVVLSDAPAFTDYFITATKSRERTFSCLYDKRKIIPKKNTKGEWCDCTYATITLKLYKLGKLAKIVTDTTGWRGLSGSRIPDFAISEALAWIQNDLGIETGGATKYYEHKPEVKKGDPPIRVPLGAFDVRDSAKYFYAVYKPYVEHQTLKWLFGISDKEETAKQMKTQQDTYNRRKNLVPFSKDKIDELREYFPGYRRNFVKENQNVTDKFLSGENFMTIVPAKENPFDEFDYYMLDYRRQVAEGMDVSAGIRKFINEFDDGTLKNFEVLSKQPADALYLWQIAYDFELAGETSFAAVLYITVLDNTEDLVTSLPIMHSIRLKALQGLKRIAQKRNMPVQTNLVDLCVSLTLTYLESSEAQTDEDEYRKDMVSVIQTTQESYEVYKKAKNKALLIGLASIALQTVGNVADSKASTANKWTQAEKNKFNSKSKRNVDDAAKRRDAVAAGVKDVIKDINAKIKQVNASTEVSDIEIGKTFIAPIAMYFLDVYDQMALPIFETFAAKYPELSGPVKTYKAAATQEDKDNAKVLIHQNITKLEILSAQYERTGKPIPKLETAKKK